MHWQEVTLKVVVIGAGAAGLLTATLLANCGIEVWVVDGEAIGGRQTSSCHGYLHLGYAYADAEKTLCQSFADSWRHWDSLLAGLQPVTSSSTILFEHERSVSAAMLRWSRRGLAIRRTPPPAWVAPEISRGFLTAERTYDMALVVDRLIAICAASDVHIVPEVSVDALRDDGNRVYLSLTGESAGEVPTSLDAVVVAAGAATRDLLPKPLSTAVVNRLSNMLVLAGDLPLQSSVFPERDKHGLFIAARPGRTAEERIWLVSTFHSFDERGRECPPLLTWWTQHVLIMLRRVMNPAQYDAISHIAVYQTVKSGLVPTAGTVAAAGVRHSLHSRILAAVPSKFTLAPLVADEATRTVCRLLGVEPHVQSLVGNTAPRRNESSALISKAETWRGRRFVPFTEDLRPMAGDPLLAALSAVG